MWNICGTLLFSKVKKPGKPRKIGIPNFSKAGDERIELPPKVLETPIIPFDQSPVPELLLNKRYYNKAY